HHNARRKAQADNENLRDEDDLTAFLGEHLDLLLHGHTHEGKEDRLSDDTLVLATGSAAVSADRGPGGVPKQCPGLPPRPRRGARGRRGGGGGRGGARQWDGRRRWLADPRASRDGSTWPVVLDLATPGWQQRRPADPRLERELWSSAGEPWSREQRGRGEDFAA